MALLSGVHVHGQSTDSSCVRGLMPLSRDAFASRAPIQMLCRIVVCRNATFLPSLVALNCSIWKPVQRVRRTGAPVAVPLLRSKPNSQKLSGSTTLSGPTSSASEYSSLPVESQATPSIENGCCASNVTRRPLLSWKPSIHDEPDAFSYETANQFASGAMLRTNVVPLFGNEIVIFPFESLTSTASFVYTKNRRPSEKPRPLGNVLPFPGGVKLSTARQYW